MTNPAMGWDDWTPSSPEEDGEGGGESPGSAVAQLLEELDTETAPQPVLTVEGLSGRVAVVTGASRGIGRAIAVDLARHGVHIGFNYREEREGGGREEAEEAAEVVEGHGVRVFFQACDVGDSEAVDGFMEAVEERLGAIQILVNNAGIGRDRALWRMVDEDWEDVLRTNLSGAFYCLRSLAPRFRAQEFGKVVNIASVHGRRSEFGLANYSASKAGLISLTRNAAVELGPFNVNVNAVAPGYIRTTSLTDGVPSEILDQARAKSALGRLGDPQDVAGVVTFLCSEAARHISGAVIPIHGGYLL